MKAFLQKTYLRFFENDLLKSIMFFIFLVTVGVVVAHYFDTDLLRSWVTQFGIWGVVIYIVAKSLALIIAPISGTPIYIIGAFVYGPFAGMMYSFIGDMLGAVVSFYLARKIGRVWVDKLFSKKEEGVMMRLMDMFSSPKGIFLSHIFCVTFPDILNYAAGLSRASFKTYMLIHTPFTLAVIAAISYGSFLVTMLGSHGLIMLTVVGLCGAVAGMWFMTVYSKVSLKKK